MRASFIKPRSHTQRAATKVRNVKTEVCRRAGISHDQWTSILFETGFKWAHENIESDEQRTLFLEDYTRGFWAWWIAAFTNDDKELIEAGVRLSAGRYNDLKSELIYASED